MQNKKPSAPEKGEDHKLVQRRRSVHTSFDFKLKMAIKITFEMMMMMLRRRR